TLNYSSLRADPRPIVTFGYDDVPAVLDEFEVEQSDATLVASLKLKYGPNVVDVPGFNIPNVPTLSGLNGFSIPVPATPAIPGEKPRIDASLQPDLSGLPTGLYDMTLR